MTEPVMRALLGFLIAICTFLPASVHAQSIEETAAVLCCNYEGPLTKSEGKVNFSQTDNDLDITTDTTLEVSGNGCVLTTTQISKWSNNMYPPVILITKIDYSKFLEGRFELKTDSSDPKKGEYEWLARGKIGFVCRTSTETTQATCRTAALHTTGVNLLEITTALKERYERAFSYYQVRFCKDRE